ncbi:MAG: glycosyltransferase family 39 protein [Solirubrobacterales bacterium]
MRAPGVRPLLATIVLVGAVVRFASLGVQSYHHDEVITAGRVLAGGFGHMLHEVRVSESNPPLYYVLAWAWSRLFGTAEVGLRSLSALLGTATVPVAFLAARELAGRRAGLIAAALVALDPMLIWYSQEARSYAALVCFGALALWFFARALRTRSALDLGLWALASALALWSHYFAVFAIAVEAAWLLVALHDEARKPVAAAAAVGLAGVALAPLLAAQVNPHHIGWIERTTLPSRLVQSGVSFLAGETGHVIAEPPRELYALLPALIVLAAVALAARRGAEPGRRAAPALAVGLGVPALAAAAALAGRDYVVERNLLPALVPLAVALAIGLAAAGRRLSAALAVAVCLYWLAFAVYITQTPNLQRPDLRGLTRLIGPPRGPRAIVGWRLAADPVDYYLADGALRLYSGPERLREVVLVSKAHAAPPTLRRPFREVARVRLHRLSIVRFRAPRAVTLWFHTLRDLPSGFGRNAVLVDGLHSQRARPADAGLRSGRSASVHPVREAIGPAVPAPRPPATAIGPARPAR